MKMRAKYTKTGAARFLSHLELIQGMERAMRRADLPLSFSEGYHPHPKISYASALPVGMESMAEYLDVELDVPMSERIFVQRLNEVLFEGISILEAKSIDEKVKTKSLTAIIERSLYEVSFEMVADQTIQNPLSKVDEYLSQKEIQVERITKHGKRMVDIRNGIFDIKAEITGKKIFMELFLLTGSKGNVRPLEVVDSFLTLINMKKTGIVRICRQELYALCDGNRVTPMEILEG